MKHSKIWILSLLASVLVIGCTTTNSTTGEKEYDPIKTEQVKAMIEPFVIIGTRRALDETYDRNPAVLSYLQQSAEFVCKMRDEQKFAPEFLIDGLDAGLIEAFGTGGVDPLILDLKTLIVGLYKVNYSNRFDAELNPQAFLIHALDVICNALSTATADFVIERGL